MGDHITVIYKNRAFDIYALEEEPGSWTPEIHERKDGRTVQTLRSHPGFRTVTGCVVHAVREAMNRVNREGTQP